MAISLLRSHELGTHSYYVCNNQNSANMTSNMHLLAITLSSNISQQDALSRRLLSIARVRKNSLSFSRNLFQCQSFLIPNGSNVIPVLKNAITFANRSIGALHVSPILFKLSPAVSIIAFALWGLGPLMRLSRIIFLQRNDSTWKKSNTNFVITSYLQPLLLWTGAILVCRVLDPIIMPTEASQAVKQRVVNFVRSLSSVVAFAYSFSSLIQQAQTFFRETNDSNDARNMGFQFAGKAVYSAVWVAAVSLFMELLGFSTQKWLTAGGLGTVLLTLAGREIFTNFLSSVMIHATRPFVLNEWIQTKIEGYEVSGTVEHVGWWSPTIIRGDDREAIHIPNHKFTMNVVRNLSQKTHWRIKNYLAISHLDVNKINNIVADMRKVLAKNPHVEQQKLHRRVFLENINPENQALMILVSCFVKTSHFEEYLCVKEAVILDLLRVISHHRARLATPIRTVQKIYGEADPGSNSFAETIFSSSGAAANRPLLLIEPSYKINSEDRIKVSSQTTRMNEEKEAKSVISSTPESKANVNGESTSTFNESKTDDKMASAVTSSNAGSKRNVGETTKSGSKILNSDSFGPTQKSEKQKIEKDLSNGARKVKSVDMSASGESPSNPVITAREPVNEKIETPSTISQSNQDFDKPNISPLVSRPSLEDNIVLGVALEGSKRTLPIEEEMSHVSNTELKEMAGSRNGSGSTSVSIDKKEDQIQD